jgi:hypothetical protein
VGEGLARKVKNTPAIIPLKSMRKVKVLLPLTPFKYAAICVGDGNAASRVGLGTSQQGQGAEACDFGGYS